MNTTRRGFLTSLMAGPLAGSMSGWLEQAGAAETHLPSKVKSVVLLFMAGGPAQTDTLDPKPEAPDRYRGPFGAIETSVPGIRICEHFPRFAACLKHAAIIRSLHSRQADHILGRFLVHTGYEKRISPEHPSFGAIIAKERAKENKSLPQFVSIGPVGRDTTGNYRAFGPGFLGIEYDPLVIPDPSKGLPNAQALVSGDRFTRRLDLLQEMDQRLGERVDSSASRDLGKLRREALALMQSEIRPLVDLTTVPLATLEKYGTTDFGRGCLLARRLVEKEIPFIEVGLHGWDTHPHEDSFARSKRLTLESDQGMAALIDDLDQRGLLQQTLIIWMGEFGRTPHIEGFGGKGPGRNHFTQAWCSALIGGGIRGGQVVGRTDDKAAAIADRTISLHDFLATIHAIAGVDFRKEITDPNGRPLRIVEDKKAQPMEEVVL